MSAQNILQMAINLKIAAISQDSQQFTVNHYLTNVKDPLLHIIYLLIFLLLFILKNQSFLETYLNDTSANLQYTKDEIIEYHHQTE